jgi:hypothetical protein
MIRLACMEKIMSKTTVHDPEANFEVHQLTDHELDVVSGGEQCIEVRFGDNQYAICFAPPSPPPPPPPPPRPWPIGW